MTTVLKKGKRKCDKRCHNATGKQCKCLCRGTYHGANNHLTELIKQHQDDLIKETGMKNMEIKETKLTQGRLF